MKPQWLPIGADWSIIDGRYNTGWGLTGQSVNMILRVLKWKKRGEKRFVYYSQEPYLKTYFLKLTFITLVVSGYTKKLNQTTGSFRLQLQDLTHTNKVN